MVRLFHIHRPACVRESVAVFVGGAVVVLDAVDLLAAAVVGVALVDALGARALADVVPGHADGPGAALEEVTGGLARVSPSTAVLPAHLVLGALSVVAALVGPRRGAPSPVVRIALILKK